MNRIFVILFFIIFSIVNAKHIDFTKEEKLWIKNNPLIKFAIMNYWFYNENGNNIHTELIKLLNEYGNINIVPVRFDTWKDGYDEASKAELIHGIMNLSWTKEREEKYFYYTKPYDFKPSYLIVKKNNKTINSLDDLRNKKVYVKQKDITKKILEDCYFSVNTKELKNISALLESFSSNDPPDAILSYKIDKKTLDKYNLKVTKKVFSKYSEHYIGIAHKYKILKDIINKIFDEIPKNKLLAIQNKNYSKSAAYSNTINLTKEEMHWIEKNPIIKVGGEMDWPPFDYVDEKGNYNGLANDYLKLISKKTGLNFKVITNKTWKELLSALKNKEIDLLPALNYSKEREKYSNFTVSYLHIPDYFITKIDYPKIDSIESLYGKTVVAVKNYAIIDWLQKNHPRIKIKKVDSLLNALKSLQANDADVFINDNPSFTYMSDKNFISGLKLNNVIRDKKPNALYMATRKDYNILISILNKAIKSISIEEKRLISSHWMQEVNDNIKMLTLSENELIWLANKKVLKFVVDPNWAPVEYLNEKNGKYEGIMSEVLDKISKISGIKFELYPTTTWQESLEAFNTNKVDVINAISMTKKRKKDLNFSDVTFLLADGIIMKNTTNLVTSIEDLKGFTFGISKGTALEEMVEHKYPILKTTPVYGIENALKMLENGEIDGYIGNLEVLSHFILKNSLFNLKVVYRFKKKRELHMAFNKSVPKEAINIINKAIKTIPKSEIELIRQRWISLNINDELDYTIFYKIAIGILALVIFFTYWNRKLKKLVDLRTEDLKNQKDKLAQFNINLEKLVKERTSKLEEQKIYIDSIMNSQSNLVLSTNGKKIKTVNSAFLKFFEVYYLEDFFEKYGDCISNTFVNINSREYISGYKDDIFLIEKSFKNSNKISKVIIKKNGKNHIFSLTTNNFIFGSEKLAVVVLTDISELEMVRKNIEVVLSNIMIPVIISSQKTRKIIYANASVSKQLKCKKDELIGKHVDILYSDKTSSKDVVEEIIEKGSIRNKEKKFKRVNNEEYIGLLSIKPIVYNEEDCFIGMLVDITKQKEIEEEIRHVHENIKSSIEYASLIQHSLIPTNNLFEKYFDDYFTLWQPKDIVGGDIYLFDELRDDNECLLMVIDCTGHGVPGAFVTMLVKAIERQVSALVRADKNMKVSPAWILKYFNQTIKKLLKQEDEKSISNAGFDAAIFYYNKIKKEVRFAGAEIPLFYIENGKVNVLKADRHSIGYKKSDANYEFTEYSFELKNDMQFYITTDGYLHQNGGERGFPFGKKRFVQILEKYKDLSFKEQKEIFINKLKEYQKNEVTNDDITIVSLKIKNICNSEKGKR